jgi:hypothetical protein
MNKSAIIAALVGVAGIAAIGLSYKYCVEPQIPVWAEGDKAVHWERSRIPLKVYCDDMIDDCRAAVAMWNRDVGCTLLVWDPTGPGDIRIISAAANSENRIGDAIEQTFASKTGETVNYVLVEIYEPQLSGDQYAVDAHAISHGLGLVHTIAGITRPAQSTWITGKKDPPPRAVDKHARALKERYCP